MTIRKNRGSAERYPFLSSPGQVSGASSHIVNRYTDAHWGNSPTWMMEYDRADLPQEIWQMGVLVGFWVDGSPEHGGAEIMMPDVRSHLAVDPGEAEKLYLLLSTGARRAVKHAYWAQRAPVFGLQDVAKHIGGRQASYRVPQVRVKCIAQASHILYKTNKVGDGSSTYVHEFGEEGGIAPMLCVDADGHLYLAGGSYTVPDAGITN